MNILQTLRTLEYLHYLFTYSATGTPKEMAKKLCISERQFFRLIADLRHMGLPIEYSHIQRSYKYTDSTLIRIDISVGSQKLFKIHTQ